ncbi:ubiquitin-protein ligase BRE1, putative [Pediculus humanus corporis]|uniref:Ubiquitin-protein ligase BRE1, putative n=1 Tax=Pediculus humanus subsp. corporis TaxID=121224 RepID=E0VAN5_PEDHC|nr:ubiquitin-protein ligase BRE1, putative [Pediculus humanus corporis]EEB10441.1 ubiquitin-protein ligase BRE1, putative [Pediculus humanus corporis]
MKENIVVKCETAEEKVDFPAATANGCEIKENFNSNNSVVDGSGSSSGGSSGGSSTEPENSIDVEMISDTKKKNSGESNNNDLNDEKIKNKVNGSDEIIEEEEEEIENVETTSKIENEKLCDTIIDLENDLTASSDKSSEVVMKLNNENSREDEVKNDERTSKKDGDENKENEKIEKNNESEIVQIKDNHTVSNESSTMKKNNEMLTEEDDVAEVIECDAKKPIVSKDDVKNRTTEQIEKENSEKEKTKEKTETDQKVRFNLRKRSRLNSYVSSKKKKTGGGGGGECVQERAETDENSSLGTNEKSHSRISSDETKNINNDIDINNHSDSFHLKNVKKQKIDNREKETVLPSSFLNTLRGTLKNLTRNDLEELIVQKLCEVITERSVVGELRRRTQVLEEDQEKWKAKAQSLTKQIKEMEMIMRKYLNEVQKQTKAGSDHQLIVPLRVTRSVGLQVSFLSNSNKVSSKGTNAAGAGTNLTDGGISEMSPNLINNNNNNNNNNSNSKNSRLTPQKVQQKNKPGSSTQGFSASPSAVTTPTQYKKKSNVSRSEINSSLQTLLQSQQNNNNSKIIDLTEDDDRQVPPFVDASGLVKVVNYPLRPQVPPNNNRYTYILPNSNITPTVVSAPQNRQVLLAASAVCPPQSNNRQIMSMPPLLFKGGTAQQQQPPPPPGYQPSVLNQSNHVIPAKLLKHPAPLPQQPTVTNSKSNSKLLPPRPALKISRVQSGIVLSWNMSLGPEHAAISSYQLYAYQEGSSPPATSLWKKVGDVKALPLPMACTLTQFTSGHKYHFAVRAVDQHSRVGPFSLPGTIALVK